MLYEGEQHAINRCVNVESLIILPIQRIPRYVLLLTDLLQHTDKHHPDYSSLEKCTEAMKEVAVDINTAITKAEARAKCLNIQSLWDTKFNTKQLPISSLVEAHRVFIKDGHLTKQCRNERKIRRFFLFNDLLIYAHISGPERRLVVDRTFFLETTSIQDGSLDPSLPGNELAFQIIGVGKSFTVYADSIDEKQEWMSILEETISQHKDFHNRSGNIAEDETAPLWIPNDSVNECMSCTKEFTLIRRKHHCRRCGQIICDECSKTRAIITAVARYKGVRICDKCKETIIP
jgi:FYVE/RhoGEF/PH domain-containing protein 5/6